MIDDDERVIAQNEADTDLNHDSAPSADGLVGDVEYVEVAHTQWVGETREHNEDPNKCWCWPEWESRMTAPTDKETSDE